MPVVSIDPGHRNILQCSYHFTDKETDAKKYSLSLGSYYEKIGNKKYLRKVKKCIEANGLKPVLELMSQNTLKTASLSKFKEHMKIVRVTCNLHYHLLFKVFGCRSHARGRFHRVKRKQRFYSTIVENASHLDSSRPGYHNSKTAKRQVMRSLQQRHIVRVGLSACPIAKRRKVVGVNTTPEAYTTER